MVFASREDAGRKLGLHLKSRGIHADFVLGLPRGGVVVAAEVARILKLPLDVLIVRKIGHPLQREFAVGALAEGEVVVLDEKLVGADPILHSELREVIREESSRLRDYQKKFHVRREFSIADKTVLLVDDGLATGATTEAAVLSARSRHARRVVVTAPVASFHALGRLEPIADEVIVLDVDPRFDAVGRYYEAFSQTTDAEVIGLLEAA